MVWGLAVWLIIEPHDLFASGVLLTRQLIIFLIPHELIHGGAAGLRDAFAAQHLADGHQDDADVQPERPVIHVPDIQLKTLIPSQRVAAVHLRPAGDAGRQLMPAGLLR